MYLPKPILIDGKYICSANSTHKVIPSIPPGAEYCQTCVQIAYDNAEECPICGTKIGFAFGTGDCGCETPLDVGM